MHPVPPTHYLALDLGAESGRVMLGTLHGGQLRLRELHRFPTGALPVGGTLRWDLPRIVGALKDGLAKAAALGLPIRSLSTDSWGVDYVLLRDGAPLDLPHHYRDPRTDDGLARAFALVPQEEIFAQTGIQFLTLNTLYQLHAEARERPEVLARAQSFLTIADYVNFLFSGAAAIEESNASTTQLYDPSARAWSDSLIAALGLPRALFPPVVPSGTRLGTVRPGVLAGDWSATEVIATCSHDTGAAVAATPGEGEEWAYLSSGTWSLLGIESATPLLGAEALRENFTNEIGHGGTIRFLKNIVGLWIVQECRRAWALAGNEFSYAELVEAASVPPALRSLIHPASVRFAKPDAMPEKIAAYCRETGQPVPSTPGETIRCALESLALFYAANVDRLEALTGRRIARLHVVGGGSRNTLLNQFTADALGRPVLAGPAEATAIGNLLLQALALGDLGPAATLADLRQVVRDSFPSVAYDPESEQAETWRAARARFAALPVLD